MGQLYKFIHSFFIFIFLKKNRNHFFFSLARLSNMTAVPLNQFHDDQMEEMEDEDVEFAMVELAKFCKFATIELLHCKIVEFELRKHSKIVKLYNLKLDNTLQN